MIISKTIINIEEENTLISQQYAFIHQYNPQKIYQENNLWKI
jgi:hypothetical protein